MRLFPILTAAIVCVVLYFAILDRETLVGFASQFGGSEATETAEPEAETAEVAASEIDDRVHVTVRQSQAQTAENAVILRGRTEAVRQVTVAAETSGRIVSEPIRAGATVTAGQLMCEIDPRHPRRRAGRSRGPVAGGPRPAFPRPKRACPNPKRVWPKLAPRSWRPRSTAPPPARLSESGFASETRAATASAALASASAAVEAAQAGVQAAEAGIQSAQSGILAAEASVIRAEEDIARLTITAPFDGVLESDTAELGSLMQPGTPCATIIQLDPMKLVGFVPEAQVDRINLGAMAGARLSTGAEVVGEVTFLSRSADPQTRTFRVEILVNNADRRIRDGQSADIIVETPGTLAHLLPTSAMTLNDEGTLGVRIVVDGIVEFAPVQLLRDTARGVWLAGLPEQVDIITVGQDFVTQGVPVRVTYEELTQ